MPGRVKVGFGCWWWLVGLLPSHTTSCGSSTHHSSLLKCLSVQREGIRSWGWGGGGVGTTKTHYKCVPLSTVDPEPVRETGPLPSAIPKASGSSVGSTVTRALESGTHLYPVPRVVGFCGEGGQVGFVGHRSPVRLNLVVQRGEWRYGWGDGVDGGGLTVASVVEDTGSKTFIHAPEGADASEAKRGAHLRWQTARSMCMCNAARIGRITINLKNDPTDSATPFQITARPSMRLSASPVRQLFGSSPSFGRGVHAEVLPGETR
ncbi:hypothetical protein DFJ77DRAFT_436357 [Powellomyces hirtus]|nr:hypothetical protein DFJ77DRAFT_436357 [Powellomyces hirtus]